MNQIVKDLVRPSPSESYEHLMEDTVLQLARHFRMHGIPKQIWEDPVFKERVRLDKETPVHGKRKNEEA